MLKQVETDVDRRVGGEPTAAQEQIRRRVRSHYTRGITESPSRLVGMSYVRAIVFGLPCRWFELHCGSLVHVRTTIDPVCRPTANVVGLTGVTVASPELWLVISTLPTLTSSGLLT